MTGMIGDTDDRERGLLPYVVIVAANKGDPEAMQLVIQNYESYITYRSLRKMCDEHGNYYYGVDEEIRDCLRAVLIKAVLAFNL